MDDALLGEPRSKPPHEVSPFEPESQLRKDYRSRALALYSVQPPERQRTIGLTEEETVEELTIGRLERCYAEQFKNQPSTIKLEPDVTIFLEKELAGGIKETPGQTWTASMSDGSTGAQYCVAKFFDPLYSRDEAGLDDGIKIANNSVATEHEAYMRLSPLQGSKIPRLLGLYLATFSIPDHPTRCVPPSSRNVYVLLLEFIPGTPLNKLEPKSVDRDRIMDDVFELKAHAVAFGVRHRDFFPRNLILRPGVNGMKDIVVMFDFESSVLMDAFDGEWDSSEAARAGRIATRRADPMTERSFRSWKEEGWFGAIEQSGG